MKFCKDCKHRKEGEFGGNYCMHPNNFEPSLVTGKTKLKRDSLEYCNDQRKQGIFFSWLLPACGIKGAWYEPEDANS